MVSAIILLGALAVGGTLSYMVANTDTQHKVSASNLKVKLVQPEKKDDKVVPGERIAYPVKVANTGDYPLYARITVKKYWSKGDKKEYDGDSTLISLLNKDKEHWIMDDKTDAKNAEVVYFYSKKPIAAGETSTAFIDQVQISENVTSAERAMKFHVDCSVDAVQNVDVKKAIMAEWGIDVDVADDGTLSIVNE